MRPYTPGGVGIGLLCMMACGGGDKSASSSAGNTTSTAAPSPAPAPSAAAPGKTIDVKMVGDTKGYRFDPATITVTVGDGVRFTNVSGGPHDVTFWSDSIPAGAQQVLQANMPATTAPLTGPLLISPNDTYVVSFAGAKPGAYHFYCTPHLALGMRGTLTVQ